MVLRFFPCGQIVRIREPGCAISDPDGRAAAISRALGYVASR